MVHPSVCFAAGCVSLVLWAALGSGSLILNSNAIKSLMPGAAGTPVLHGGAGGHVAGSSPDDFALSDGGNHNLLIDAIQALSCAADAECAEHEFCYASRGACLPCKRRRKRCARDGMCCPGNQCSNGVCLPVDADIVQQFTVEETEPSASSVSSATSGQGTSRPLGAVSIHLDNGQDKQNSTTQPTATHDPHALSTRGLEGERCLRSADCTEGLCCARHFWSKICKPVLREGQVCTKHRKKGALGLEIFQRCDCGAGLACRTQRGAEEHRMHKVIRTLHTCQQH